MTEAELKQHKELYELSGWDSDELSHQDFPLYTVKYLKSKLPQKAVAKYDTRGMGEGVLTIRLAPSSMGYKKGIWLAEYKGSGITVSPGSTPREAILRLAIKMVQYEGLK